MSTGVGAEVMAMLMLCRHHFAWWPLHPIGYPISGLWLMSHSCFSIFLAWLCKWVVLKYWGPRGYRAVRPFFLGVILGQFVSAGLWLVLRGVSNPAIKTGRRPADKARGRSVSVGYVETTQRRRPGWIAVFMAGGLAPRGTSDRRVYGHDGQPHLQLVSCQTRF